MFSEDDLLPISALQHWLFCPRQCALIHLERQWAENRLTVEGQHLHRRAHERQTERRDDVHIVRGLPIRSLRYSLVGQTDVVEFAPLDDEARARFERGGAGLAVVSVGRWSVVPIEYKRGRPKKDDSDRVQLAAQALCLEEMLNVEIAAGALFYGKRRRRTAVAFDGRLRDVTLRTVEQLRAMLSAGRTPPARREPKCDNCSLVNLCLPNIFDRARGMTTWFDAAVSKHLSATGPAAD